MIIFTSSGARVHTRILPAVHEQQHNLFVQCKGSMIYKLYSLISVNGKLLLPFPTYVHKTMLRENFTFPVKSEILYGPACIMHFG